MEHPLIDSLDSLTVDELGAKLGELQKKLGIAQRSGNAHICNQIRMAIESYQSKYNEKLQASYKKDLADAKVDTSKINIQ
jgi:hypothetical protein